MSDDSGIRFSVLCCVSGCYAEVHISWENFFPCHSLTRSLHAPFMVNSWCLVAELCRNTYHFVKISPFLLGLRPRARPISLRSISFRATPSAATAAFVNHYIPSFLASPSHVPSYSLACPLLCKRACSRSKMKIHFTFYSLNRSLINKLPEIRPSGSKNPLSSRPCGEIPEMSRRCST